MARNEPGGSGGKHYQALYRTPERTQTKKRGSRTKQDAEQFAASIEVQKYRGEFISHQTGQATVGELGPGWLVRQSTHLKPSSMKALEVGWRVHVEPRWRDVANPAKGLKTKRKVIRGHVYLNPTDRSTASPVRLATRRMLSWFSRTPASAGAR